MEEVMLLLGVLVMEEVMLLLGVVVGVLVKVAIMLFSVVVVRLSRVEVVLLPAIKAVSVLICEAVEVLVAGMLVVLLRQVVLIVLVTLLKRVVSTVELSCGSVSDGSVPLRSPLNRGLWSAAGVSLSPVICIKTTQAKVARVTMAAKAFAQRACDVVVVFSPLQIISDCGCMLVMIRPIRRAA